MLAHSHKPDIVAIGHIFFVPGCAAALVGHVMILTVARPRILWWFFVRLSVPVVWIIFLFLNLKLMARSFGLGWRGCLVAWHGARMADIACCCTCEKIFFNSAQAIAFKP